MNRIITGTYLRKSNSHILTSQHISIPFNSPMTTCAATQRFLKESPVIPIPDSHVASDLPCPEDIDLEPVPQPSYFPHEIVEIQQILGTFLPVELLDVVIDMAEIWPYVVISRNSYSPALTALEGPDGNAQWCHLVSPPVPTLKRNNASLPTAVKKVKFNIKAYNSCWGAEKPERGSFPFYVIYSFRSHKPYPP